MTRAGCFAPAGLTALCLVGACLLLPATVLPAEPARTIALVDFVVRAPASPDSAASWLGPAVSELVQAKLQLFGGARVLERLRVQSLLREAKVDAGTAADAPASLVAFIPAEVLVAGSVNVDPKDQRRIRVQARAFETGTSKIVAEATFTGSGDLAGLLKIAEDLARTLADGLKLAYTPQQLAYAEPAGIDTLRLFVRGEEQLAAGGYREAIASLQGALEGNEGRYYAAAHRLQGEAYQALAKVSAGEQERSIRAEYLRKFKEDALAASGALYDLGLAYEANGMWREAVEAYGDYLTAVGSEAQASRWRLRLADDLAIPPEWNGNASFHGVFLDHGRAHFLSPRQGRWFSVDLVTGKVAAEIDLSRVFDAPVGPPRRVNARLHGVAEGQAVLSWQFTRPDTSVPPSMRPFAFVPLSPLRLSSLDMQGSVRWSLDLEEASRLEDAWVSGGWVFCSVYGKRGDEAFGSNYLLTVDAADGRVLSRSKLLLRGGSLGPSLAELDLERAVLTLKDGMWDLIDGSRIPFRREGELGQGNSRVPQPLAGEAPTGKRGVTFRRLPGGDQFFADGAPLAFLEKCAFVQQHPIVPGDGPLLCRREQGGYALYEPTRGTSFTLYADLPSTQLPPLLAADRSLLVFGYQMSPTVWEADPRYALPYTEVATVLNVFDAAEGTLLAKHLFRGFAKELQVFILERDLLVASNTDGGLTRLSLLPGGGLATTPAAEAHLRRAVCSGKIGDEEGMRRSLSLFEAEYPRDPRADLLRMSGAVRRGSAKEAADLALRVLLSGLIEETELRECLEAVRLGHPEVRAALVTPFKAPLELASLAAPGVLVATPLGGRRGLVHALIDVGTGRTRVVETPELAGAERAYLAGAVFVPRALGGGAGRILKVNLLDESRGQSEVFPFFASGERFVPGAALAIQVRTEFSAKAPLSMLWFFDPETLETTATLPFVADEPRFTDGALAVFVGKDPQEGRGQVPMGVIDRETGREVGRVSLEVKGERVTGVAANRETLFAAVAGRDGKKLLAGDPGALWMRVLALPLDRGGASWEFVAEGYLAGYPVLEGEHVVFPAWFGRLPAPSPDPEQVGKYRIDGVRTLRKVMLDRRTGRQLADRASPGAGPDEGWAGPVIIDASSSGYLHLDGLFQPAPLRVIFPGRTESVLGWKDPGSYWWYAPHRPPVRVMQTGKEREYKVIGERPFPPVQLYADGIVFESIGGGVILLKEFAGGEGMVKLGPR